MAIGKNKKTVSKRKGNKKNVDPFVRKEWYTLRAPKFFKNTKIGETLTTKTTGQKTARSNLLKRVVEANLGELEGSQKVDTFRKYRFVVDEVQGNQCLTAFQGMDMTTDKLRSLVRKHFSLIEAFTDVKTSDGYVLRVFAIAFTKKGMNQVKSTTYAQQGHIRLIRKKMVSIIQKEVSKSDIHRVILKLNSEAIGQSIEKQCRSIYPLQNVLTRKVKVIKTPEETFNRLIASHGGATQIQKYISESAAAPAAAPAADVIERVAEEVVAA